MSSRLWSKEWAYRRLWGGPHHPGPKGTAGAEVQGRQGSFPSSPQDVAAAQIRGHWTGPVHPKGDQSCVFIGGTDVEAETPILWPPDVES